MSHRGGCGTEGRGAEQELSYQHTQIYIHTLWPTGGLSRIHLCQSGGVQKPGNISSHTQWAKLGCTHSLKDMSVKTHGNQGPFRVCKWICVSVCVCVSGGQVPVKTQIPPRDPQQGPALLLLLSLPHTTLTYPQMEPDHSPPLLFFLWSDSTPFWEAILHITRLPLPVLGGPLLLYLLEKQSVKLSFLQCGAMIWVSTPR